MRNSKGEEVTFIEHLEGLDGLSKNAIKQSLSNLSFALDIEEIHFIKDEVDIRKFSALTKQGERIFYTELEDWPEIKDDGSIYLTDIHRDIYRIKDVQRLDQSSQKWLSPFIH